ncbi:MAG: hypothetical protein LBS64_06210 [Spirochaetaceae bacterium]|nr:hypothetical protein [Spirochaetaceae bacterium]
MPVDWLFLMYLDGDNNLQASIRQDLNEMEAGIYQLPNEVAVSVVVLWDGAGAGDSQLYELGPDTNPGKLGVYTVDVTGSAEWIQNNEVDMSDGKTLTDFLVWAKKRYPAKNVVLQFGDHGAGPRTAAVNRAMMVDDTTGTNSLMYSKEVSQAFYGAFVENPHDCYWNHLGLVLFDICLGASLEDAYEIYPFAKYAVASPGAISGKGMNYTTLIGGLTPEMDITALGKRLVSDYKKEYAAVKSRGLTCIDLAQVQNVRAKLDILAALLLKQGDLHKFGQVFISSSGTPLSLTYLDASALLLRSTQAGYSGTFTWLYDLGIFAEQMALSAAPQVGGGANPGRWDEMEKAAKDLTAALRGAIVCSWNSGGIGEAGRLNIPYDGARIPYGITICGAPSTSTGGAGYPGWYRTDLTFGATSKWYDLLAIWYARHVWDR